MWRKLSEGDGKLNEGDGVAVVVVVLVFVFGGNLIKVLDSLADAEDLLSFEARAF